jgi:hypothetical protein
MNWWEYLQGLGQAFAPGMSSSMPVLGMAGRSAQNWWQNRNGTPGGNAGGGVQGQMGAGGQMGPSGQVPPPSKIGRGTGQPIVNAGNMPRVAPLSANAGVGGQMGGGGNVGPVQGQGGMGVSGAAGAGGPTRTLPGVAGAGGQGVGGQIPVTPLDRGHKTLDAQFAQKHGGMSPIQFYGNAFPQIQDPEQRMNAAINAAANDASFQPGWINEWQKVHGNTPIPQEAWEKAWWQAQNGGANFGQGAGINPWGVY